MEVKKAIKKLMALMKQSKVLSFAKLRAYIPAKLGNLLFNNSFSCLVTSLVFYKPVLLVLHKASKTC